MALLEPFSSLWQLAFKEPPWLALLCCLEQQALKGTPLAGVLPHCSAQSGTQRATLSRVFLYWSAAGAGVWGWERLQCWLHPLHVAQQYCLASMTAQLSSKGIPHWSLLPPSPQAVSSQSTANLAPGLLSNPYAPAPSLWVFQGTCVPCPGCGKVCLCSSHSIQTVTGELLHSPMAHMLPLHPKCLPQCGDLTPTSVPPAHGCRFSPAHSLLSPSFLHPTELSMSLYSFPVSGTLVCSQLMFCKISYIWRFIYSWCICGERCTPCLPTLLPYCLSPPEFLTYF